MHAGVGCQARVTLSRPACQGHVTIGVPEPFSLAWNTSAPPEVGIRSGRFAHWARARVGTLLRGRGTSKEVAGPFDG